MLITTKTVTTRITFNRKQHCYTATATKTVLAQLLINRTSQKHNIFANTVI